MGARGLFVGTRGLLVRQRYTCAGTSAESRGRGERGACTRRRAYLQDITVLASKELVLGSGGGELCASVIIIDGKSS